MSPEDVCDLKLDYTKSLASVIQDATRYVLSQNNNLGLLRFVNNRKSDLEVGKVLSSVRRASSTFEAETENPRPINTRG